MADGFPYFKFTATEWLTGDIVYEDFELQGIFINVCAIYWHRNGNVSFDELQKRLKTERLNSLIDRFIFVIDGNVSIKFLDEQLIAANHKSKVNSKNGSLGGRPKKTEQKANANRTLTEQKAKKSKEEKEEELKQELNKSKLELTFDAFLEMRKKIKKPATERAIELLKEDLEKLSKGNEQTKILILEQSIKNSWQGLFELKKVEQTTTLTNSGRYKGYDEQN